MHLKLPVIFNLHFCIIYTLRILNDVSANVEDK